MPKTVTLEARIGDETCHTSIITLMNENNVEIGDSLIINFIAGDGKIISTDKSKRESEGGFSSPMR